VALLLREISMISEGVRFVAGSILLGRPLGRVGPRELTQDCLSARPAQRARALPPWAKLSNKALADRIPGFSQQHTMIPLSLCILPFCHWPASRPREPLARLRPSPGSSISLISGACSLTTELFFFAAWDYHTFSFLVHPRIPPT
jgi:hypothetical protein